MVPMKKIYWPLFAFLLISFTLSIKAEQALEEEGTKVVFYIENEIQQPEDFVQISIEIKSQNPSLQIAIAEANTIVQKVQSTVTKYCQTHAKNKKDCQDVVQTSQYQIDPIYQLVRKVPTFVAFSVTHQTVAKIKEIKNIGKLADDILKNGVSKINSFQWKPLKQIDNQEQAVTEGIQLINNICTQIGSQLGRIVAVSQVTDYEDEQEEKQAEQQDQQGEQAEQQQEQEEPTVVYRFEIICQSKSGKGKK